MKKILITGSEGFIGSHLVKHLSKSFEIIKFDLRISSFQDTREPKYVMKFLKENKPDIVVHLAANADVSMSKDDAKIDLELNTVGTINMLDAIKETGIDLFILSSSAQVYGEPQYLPMNEEHPLNPKSAYAIAKMAAEKYCDFYREKFGLPTTIFRFFNVYGPGQPATVVIPNLINKINLAKNSIDMLGSKNDSRDFIYVDDICDAFDKCIQHKPVGEIINLGSGKETKILELSEVIAKILNKKIKFIYSDKINPSKINRMIASIDKAKKILKWEPKTNLEDGVKKVIKDFLGDFY